MDNNPTPPTGDPAPPVTPAPPSPAPARDPAPGATPPAAPATNEDDPVTLSGKDYKNIISQRDKAINAAKSQDGQAEFVASLAQAKYVADFIVENKDKFPDVTSEDLEHVYDPDQLSAEAARIQRRLQDHAQSKILDIETAGSPVLSPAEKAEKLKQLENSGDPGAFSKMLDLRMPA